MAVPDVIGAAFYKGHHKNEKTLEILGAEHAEARVFEWTYFSRSFRQAGVADIPTVTDLAEVSPLSIFAVISASQNALFWYATVIDIPSVT